MTTTQHEAAKAMHLTFTIGGFHVGVHCVASQEPGPDQPSHVCRLSDTQRRSGASTVSFHTISGCHLNRSSRQ